MFTNLNLQQMVKDHSKSHKEIEVAILGAGWYGRGLAYELHIWPGMDPRMLFDRDADKAVDVLIHAGIDKNRIVLVQTSTECQKAFREGKYIASSNIDLIKELPREIDVFFECTGNVLAAAESALTVIKQKIHFVTVSAEMDATVGYVINKMARENKVLYSNSDGDQPGVLARMVTEVKVMGFDIAVAGNGKGFLNYHATPDDIMQWVGKGQNPRKIASFTDGSKQGLEMVVLANGFGLIPDVRGMHGIKTNKETLVDDLTKVITQDNVVEYVMGKDTNLGMTVFVIGKRTEDSVAKDLKYLKMGDGPYYLFFRDYHLCYFETPKTIADIILFNKPTIFPQKLSADVLAVAKRNLKSGEKLDGIGGHTVYGLIDKYNITQKEKFLPIGLAEFAVMTRDVTRDEPITYAMVDFPKENLILQLRKEQDDLTGSHGGKDGGA